MPLLDRSFAFQQANILERAQISAEGNGDNRSQRVGSFSLFRFLSLGRCHSRKGRAFLKCSETRGHRTAVPGPAIEFSNDFSSSKGFMAQQYIFQIEALTRIYEQKEVLSDIWLSFFPGAKIGVIGDNGAGKSTLLRIMAGEDKDFMGTARPAKGIKIGYFPQEPRLEKWETVNECIQDAVSESRAILGLQRNQHEARRGLVARGHAGSAG